jgi:hypothetical protein
VVERAELPNRDAIVEDEKPRNLLVAPIWCPHSGFQDEADVAERNRVGAESPDGTLREDGLTQRHRQPAVVHEISLLAPDVKTTPESRFPGTAASTE